MIMNCIFCKIILGEIPAKILYQTEYSLCFLDAFPLTKGHSLVIPKNHHEKLQDLPENEHRDLFETVHKVMPKIDEFAGSTLLALHNGKESGQEIPHAHIHLIPRKTSDGAGAVHSMFENTPKLSPEEFEEIFSKLKID